ncbi:MAG: transposase, partial [Tannerellaceae bacterium]|nr:transposase [Tannerellaceae bacterium]
YDEQGNRYICPGKNVWAYKGHVQLNRNSGEKYQGKSGDCKGCGLPKKCIAFCGGKSPKRTLYITDRTKDENLCDKMRNKIDQIKYRAWYGRRMQIIEPYFSDMTYCKGMSRFSLRTKVTIQ